MFAVTWSLEVVICAQKKNLTNKELDLTEKNLGAIQKSSAVLNNFWEAPVIFLIRQTDQRNKE